MALPTPFLVITLSWLVCLCNAVSVLYSLIERIQFEVPIDRNGEFSDGEEKTAVTWRKRPLRAGGPVFQNWAEDRSCNHAGPFMITASIAGAHPGSGGLQCGLPLAQDLGLIRTRPEKKVGCDYRGGFCTSFNGVDFGGHFPRRHFGPRFSLQVELFIVSAAYWQSTQGRCSK